MSGSILIVEDEAIVARDLKGRLGKLGYTTAGATARGDQAVTLAEQLPPDLVLMDIHLQGDMDGIEAGRLIRSRFGIPVVFATANADSTTLQRALDAEPFGYVLKPFDERELRTTIEMALNLARSTRQLRSFEANKDAMIAAAPDGIITTDCEGRIAEFNPAAERIFGYSCADAVGKELTELLLTPASRQLYRQKIDQFRAGRSGLVSAQRLEMQAQRDDGGAFPAEVTLTQIERDNRPVVLSFWRDLSQSKAMEQQMRQAQKMQVVGQLAGGIAHDFNNLLTIINGHCEALFTSLRADFRACHRVQEIAKAGEKAARLTHQLLSFSRRQILQARVLNLNDLITDFQRMLGRHIGEDITLSTTLSPDLGPIKVDPGQIEQVLLNLVVNARDAMPSGGRLLIQTANAELDAGYACIHPEVVPGHYALVSVSDTGCGMDRETMARIFEPFFTTKEPSKRAGLGLATAYGIIKQSGGYIYIYSEPGHGTSVKIYLPLIAAEVPPMPAAGASPTLTGVETILLVEDDDGVRNLLQSTLADKGYSVLTAVHGREAMQIARKFAEPINLLLTDVFMPEMGGRALAEQFAVVHPEAKILFTSGYTDDMVMRSGVLEAEVEFLQKPYTMAAMLQKVRAVLESGIKSQESGVRGQESGVRSQETESGVQISEIATQPAPGKAGNVEFLTSDAFI